MALICAVAFQTSAQTSDIDKTQQEPRNQKYIVTLGSVQYTHHDEKLSTGEAVGKILTGVLTGQTSVQATKYEADVKNAIIKGLSGAYRFRFKDGQPDLGETLPEGSLVVDAIITNINAKSSTTTWKDSRDHVQASTTYKGIVETMLTVKDAKTGEVIANPSLTGSGIEFSSYSTSDEAIRQAIGKLSSNISAWLNKYKPLEANIIEGTAAKKDKQKEVYIDLGSSEGAFDGLHLGVFSIKYYGGREAKSQIGKIRIEAVVGPDISRCKVQSGGKDIKAAIDAGEKLRVMTIDK